MAKDPKTDAQLVALALQGSADAYRRLVLRFQKPVLSVIMRMIKDFPTAEDLAQESFVKAFRHLDRFDPSRKFSSWLFKIAHNTTLDYLRRQRLNLVPLEAPIDSEGESTREIIAAPEEQGPQALAERSEWGRGLEQALEQLRPQYREILVLRFQEELAYDEIAEVTGLTMGTVKVHLHRARKQLAKALIELGFEPPERWAEKQPKRSKEAR